MTSYQKNIYLQQNQPIHVIHSDAEALAIAKKLAAQFKENAIQRDADRILPFEEIEAYRDRRAHV